MTPQQINYCELLFTIIDRKLLPEHYSSRMYYETCNYDMQSYVLWLLNRWVLLRNHINHYPKRIDHKNIVAKKVLFNI